MSAARTLVCAMLVLCAAPLAQAAPAELSRAIELYDRGDYAGARTLLEELDAQARLDGSGLYRLFFTRHTAGDAAARQTLDRAIAALEAAAPDAATLEVPFYLVNAYQTAGRADDARRVAREALERLEQGTLAAPADGVEMFRAGKLYQDQGRSDAASEWFARALERFAGTPLETGGHAAWAHRHLARRAYDARRFGEAAEHWSAIGFDELGFDELDRLAVSRARSGDPRGAADVWRRSILKDPAAADRARYAQQLALAAGELELPPAGPDGRPWDVWTRSELEGLMAEQVQLARATREEASLPDQSLLPDERAALDERLAAARRTFVAAALEYTLDGYPIRETAFAGGYAPLVFHADAWQLPPEGARRDPAR